MAWIVPFIPLITAAIGGVAAYQQGQQQKAVLEYNAQAARQQAKAEREVARLREEQHRRQARQFAGAQRAAMGASGVDVGSGSFGDILADDAIQAELGALAIRYGGEQQSNFYLQQSRLDRMRAANAGRAGAIRGGTTLLTGLGQSGDALGNIGRGGATRGNLSLGRGGNVNATYY